MMQATSGVISSFVWYLVLTQALSVQISEHEKLKELNFTRISYTATIPENSVGKAYVTPAEKIGIQCDNKDIRVQYRIVAGDNDRFFTAEEKFVGNFWLLNIQTRYGNTAVLNRERKDKYILEIEGNIYESNVTENILFRCKTNVTVTVLDRNDLSPLFYPTEYRLDINEDTPVYSSITRVSAEDADLGVNGEIYYSLAGNSSSHFGVHTTTGEIILTRPLRYSDKQKHELTVIAQDRGMILKGVTLDKITSSAKVIVTVKRVNLYDPEIRVQHLSHVIEHATTNVYAIIIVTDRDSGRNGEIKNVSVVDSEFQNYFMIYKINSTKNCEKYFLAVSKLLISKFNQSAVSLKIRADDNGTPQRTSRKDFITIDFNGRNSGVSVFSKEIYEVNVAENSPIGTAVIRFKTNSPHQADIEIVGGNEGKEFHINSKTGTLYTARSMDYEHKSVYTLTVSARDNDRTGIGKQTSAKVIILVTDVNDNDPIFYNDGKEIFVKENEPVGTLVTRIIAKDRDSGDNGRVSYSISNSNPVPFEVDHMTGDVTTTEVLDYETMKRKWTLYVRASDWGSPYRRQSEIRVDIRLRDVNDNKPIFEKSNCIGYLPRRIPLNTEFISLTAVDFDSGNVISYRSLNKSNGCFRIDATTGIVAVGCDLTKADFNDIVLNFTATDGVHLSDVLQLRIILIDTKEVQEFNDVSFLNSDNDKFYCNETLVNKKLKDILTISNRNNDERSSEKEISLLGVGEYKENKHEPEFKNFPNRISIDESVAIGTIIVRIRASDRDLGYNGKLFYAISDGDIDSMFSMDPDSGDLKTIDSLDYERQDRYYLNITVFDQGNPQKSVSNTIDITIKDVNDNPPIFDYLIMTININENIPNNTTVFQATATDIDQGENAKIYYKLMNRDISELSIDENTGNLSVCGQINREYRDYYELRIRAMNQRNGLQTMYSDCILKIIVEDENDNKPEFQIKNVTVNIREDVPLGTMVTIVTAIDIDLDENSDVRYSLKSDDNENLFTIDRISGVIRTNGTFDYEEHQQYRLVVLAEDSGTPSFTVETNLHVLVADVDENLHVPEFSEFVMNSSVSENQPIGTLVIQVAATDNDPPGDDSRLSYSIRGGDGLGYFQIDDQGYIRTSEILDAENKPGYWLTIVAEDHGIIPLHGQMQMYVSVENVNDNVPLTVEPVYYGTVTENCPASTVVLQVSAEDADADPHHSVTFTITAGNADNLFSIDRLTGVISTTGNKIDRESQAEHDIEITINDNGSPPLSSSTRVIISVEDVNDNAPSFEQSSYSILVPEVRLHKQTLNLNIMGSANSDTVGSYSALLNNITWGNLHSFIHPDELLFQVMATDKDTGRNAELQFSLKSGRGKSKFVIDSWTGHIFAQKSLTAGQEFDLTVQVSDNGIPRKTSVARIFVKVVSVPVESKYAPSLINKNITVRVTENDPPGFLVTVIQATDEDGDHLWYKIIDGDSKSEFTMGYEVPGTILLAKQLDWESQKTYNLIIQVTDGVHSVYAKLTIIVLDVNEHRPEFSHRRYVVNISESTALNTEIMCITATDTDEDSKVVYSIHSARSQESLTAFKIDHNSGSLVVVHPLDRERSAEHVLNIMVKDHGMPGKYNFVRIRVYVEDANDHVPEWQGGILQAHVLETAVVETTIISVIASDKDQHNNSLLTYTIVSGNLENTFTLDTQHGILYLANKLDSAKQDEYLLTVKVADGGTPSLTTTIPVHILVIKSEDNSPRLAEKEISVEIYENKPSRTPVTHITATSMSPLLYKIVRGNDEETFFINPITGHVITNKELDYEETKFYSLTIVATSMDSSKAQCKLLVHILDCNDNVPQFEKLQYIGKVTEDSIIGSLVYTHDNTPLVLSARDSDSQENELLHFEVVEPYASGAFIVDSFTGIVRTTRQLDYETAQSLQFTVRVSDHGKPQLSSEIIASVHIDVVDVNDCIPVFTQNEYNATMILPAYNDTVIVQVKASDNDSAEITNLQYAILEGNSDNIYKINISSGVISVVDSNKISQTQCNLKITAFDGRHTAEAIVYIVWMDNLNSTLMFDHTVYYGEVTENSTRVTVVTVVNVIDNYLNEHVMFSLLNPTPGFQIGLTSGVISSTGITFDRENKDHYQLIVQAQSKDFRGSIRMAQALVNITVQDVNDNCPVFIDQPYLDLVSVVTPRGEVVSKVHAVDIDSEENGEVRYELSKGHGELFQVSRETGDISIKQSLEVNLKEYELSITAYDRGVPSCSAEVTVNLKVTDHSSPVFEKQFYGVTVPENIEVNTPFPVTISATSIYGSTLIYNIIDGDLYEQFSVNFTTGLSRIKKKPCVLYIQKKLDYEVCQEYVLTLRATDIVSNVFAEVFVIVTVTDINDCAPKFDTAYYNISVPEDSPVGVLVFGVTASDNDTGKNSEIYYLLEGSNKTTLFTSGDGKFYLQYNLDYETEKLYSFYVVARDKGVPSQYAAVPIWLHVLNVNDNPPEFSRASYSCRLSEEASRGQLVTAVAAYDPDFDVLYYNIVSGNQHHTFKIHQFTGVLSVANLHHLGEEQTHTVNISVTDGVHSSFTKVYIEIVPANRESPQLHQQRYEANVQENLPVGTFVVTVAASDCDSGIYGKIAYSIPSQLLLQKFNINNITGEIWTNEGLDREEKAEYELPVVATDGGGRSSWGTVHITVGDVNDNTPVFQQNEYRISIYSNLTFNSVFLKVRAEDQDEGNSSRIEYSIFEPYKNITKSLFGIQLQNGGLYLLKPALAYENQAFRFFVRATDSGTPILYRDVPVFIHIVGNNEILPVFHKGNETFSIPENTKPGTVAAKVKVNSDKPIDFKLISGTSAFSINSAGEIRTLLKLDRETDKMYHLGVLVFTLTNPLLAVFTEVTLQLLDVNDNVPYFHSDNYSIALSENTPKGTSIFKVFADDLDEGSNSEVQFSLSGDNTHFSVDPNTGWISTIAHLDKESVSSYILTLTAADNGIPVLSSATQLYISIIDYNDNPPVFVNDSYNVEVNEAVEINRALTQMSVMDRDTDTKQNIAYYIVDGDYHSQFTVLPTGYVHIIRPLNREIQDVYSITIAATDTKFVSTVQLHVTVLDVNDEKPKCLHMKYHQVISEALPPSSYVCTIMAVDADIHPKLNYYITGNGSQHFYINELTGELKTGLSLDREKSDYYMLTIHVQDKEMLQWECTSNVEIFVSDVNDNSPHFDSDNYTVGVKENVPIGLPVFKVHATDIDSGVNSKIYYYLENEESSYFNINRETGLITVTKLLSKDSKHVLTVKATDDGIPPLSSNVSIIILTSNVDSLPEFQFNLYDVIVFENVSKRSEVIQVHVISHTKGLNLQMLYSIIAGNDDRKFTINSKTGMIRVAELLDRECKSSYLLTVSATGMDSSLLSSTTLVHITVEDINDNTPEFTQTSYTVKVSEDTQMGRTVLEVVAVDSDTGSNGKLLYSLINADLYQEFYMHPHTGQLIVTKPLNREKVPHYELKIKASDNGQPQLSNVTNVSIDILDVNDNAPQFSQRNFTVIVKEDSPLGWTVYQLSVSDADSFPNADPYIYRILYDDSGGTVILEPDGLLKTNAVLNSKLQNQYMLLIRVYDNGIPHLHSETWVTVKVIGESQFPPVAYPLNVLVVTYQDHWPVTEIGKITVTDEDPYDSFVYSIVPSTYSGQFKVNAKTGVLETVTSLDAGQYTINVSVSDGKFVSYAVVTVKVKPLWDNVLKYSAVARLPEISLHEFLTNGHRHLIHLFESELQRNVSVVSIQSVTDGDLDVLLAFDEEVELMTLSNVLYSGRYGNMTILCECPKDAACRQQISINSNAMVTHSANRTSFISPSFNHELYCSCASGSVGGQCEEVLASVECKCPAPQVCVSQSEPLGYKCQSPRMCPDNHTCSTPVFSTVNTWKHTWRETAGICVCVVFFMLLAAGSFVLYRRYQKKNHRRVQSTDKPCYSNSMSTNKDVTKLSELDVTQMYTACTVAQSADAALGIIETSKSNTLIIENYETPKQKNTNSILHVETAELSDLAPENTMENIIVYGFPSSTSETGSFETFS